jgi:hypothetical protein
MQIYAAALANPRSMTDPLMLVDGEDKLAEVTYSSAAQSPLLPITTTQSSWDLQLSQIIQSPSFKALS